MGLNPPFREARHCFDYVHHVLISPSTLPSTPCSVIVAKSISSGPGVVNESISLYECLASRSSLDQLLPDPTPQIDDCSDSRVSERV